MNVNWLSANFFRSTAAELFLQGVSDQTQRNATRDAMQTAQMGDSRSCIDLIFTNQTSLVIDSGVHPSLHEQHHQIV